MHLRKPSGERDSEDERGGGDDTEEVFRLYPGKHERSKRLVQDKLNLCVRVDTKQTLERFSRGRDGKRGQERDSPGRPGTGCTIGGLPLAFVNACGV